MEVDQILLDEIRENRKEIREVKKELNVFKVRGYSFMAVISFIINVAMHFIGKVDK